MNNKVRNPLVADRNVFESLEVCVLYMIHTDRTVGYATQYKLYTLRVPSRPIIFKMFPKSETMLLVPVLPISFKLYTLYNLWVPLGPISFKLYKTVQTVQPVGPFGTNQFQNVQTVQTVQNCTNCTTCWPLPAGWSCSWSCN